MISDDRTVGNAVIRRPAEISENGARVESLSAIRLPIIPKLVGKLL
jgi:hypothetical protein